MHTKCKIIHTDIKPENILLTVDEAYVRKLANEAYQWQQMGVKLPQALVSTAPKELLGPSMSDKMSKNKKKKLKKKAKKLAEIREIQMQQLAELEMQEQVSVGGGNCPRFANEYDEEDDDDDQCCPHRNGTERLAAVDEIGEAAFDDGQDHPNNHLSSFHRSSCLSHESHEFCNGHHYKSQAGADCDGNCANSDNKNRLERSESSLVSNYQKSKEIGMRRVASCPGMGGLTCLSLD